MRAPSYIFSAIALLCRPSELLYASADEDRHSHSPDEVTVELPEDKPSPQLPVILNDELRHTQPPETVIPQQPDDVTAPPTTKCSSYQLTGGSDDASTMTEFGSSVVAMEVNYQYEMEFDSTAAASSDELILELEDVISNGILQTLLPGICGGADDKRRVRRMRFLRGKEHGKEHGKELERDHKRGLEDADSLMGLSSSPLDVGTNLLATFSLLKYMCGCVFSTCLFSLIFLWLYILFLTWILYFLFFFVCLCLFLYTIVSVDGQGCETQEPSNNCNVYQGGLTIYYTSTTVDDPASLTAYIQDIIRAGMTDASFASEIDSIVRLSYLNEEDEPEPPIIPPTPAITPVLTDEEGDIPAFVWAMMSAGAVGVLGLGILFRQRKTQSSSMEGENDHAGGGGSGAADSISNYTPVSSRFPLSLSMEKGYSVQDSEFAVEVQDQRDELLMSSHSSTSESFEKSVQS